MKLSISIKIKFAAAKVLVKELKINQLITALNGMNKRKRAGEPFKDFPAPESDKDKESRELIYEAILLYRELKRIIPQSAQSVIRKVITASAVAQLNALIPRLKKKKINSMLNDELKQKLIKILIL